MKGPNPDGEREDYLLGSGDEELGRLAFQHRVWADHAFALWKRAGFPYGGRLLDLGCGPGFTTVDLAHLVGPNGEVIAADSSGKFLRHLQSRAGELGLTNVRPLRCDVHDLELERETLDGAYARWVFCFLRDPQAVVRRVAHALRRGAAFAVTDYFNYRAFTFAPRSPALDRVVSAVERCWRRRGGDLEIQGRMPHLMAACGLEVAEVSQDCPVAAPGSPLWNWPRTFFEGFIGTLEDEGLTTAHDRRELAEAWKERGADACSRLYLPPQIAVIGVKR